LKSCRNDIIPSWISNPLEYHAHQKPLHPPSLPSPQAIEHAIEAGLARVEAGAQGQETKLARGYLPSLTYSAHYLAADNPGFRRAVADFLARERADVGYAAAALAAQQSPYRAAGAAGGGGIWTSV
jgi:hypothetical protein